MGAMRFAAVLLLGASASAQPAEPDGAQIMSEMASAVTNAGVLTMDVAFEGVGSLSVEVPRGAVRATLAPGEDGDPRWRYHAEGWLLRPKTDESQLFAFAFDGKTARCLDEQEKVLRETPPGMEDDSVVHGAARPLRWLWRWNDFVMEPFSAKAVEYPTTWLGRTIIDEQTCDIVRVDYSERPDVEELDLFWYVGTEDKMPHRVEATYFFGDGSGLGVAHIRDFQRSQVIATGAFSIEPPEGYDIDDGGADAAAEAGPAGGIPKGDKAPAWALLDADGNERTLESFRGKVVLMDFWATWCGPCKAAMPGVQALHEELGDQGLVVLGVNCWDDPDAAVAYMKDNEFTYTTLLNADDVAGAYGVSGIPTFYVVGPDGRVAHHAVGHRPGGHEALKTLIKELLPEEGG